MFIPDPESELFHPGSEFDPGCSFRIRILIFYQSRIQGSKRHWIPDPDSQHCFSVYFDVVGRAWPYWDMKKLPSNAHKFGTPFFQKHCFSLNYVL
jgi:hypothetical protein